jgi:hypothetical protein
MVRRNLCGLLVLSLVLSVAFATENKEKAEESDKKELNENKDEKTVSKRGILHHYSTHGHAHPAVVSYSHHHIPGQIVAKIPAFAKIPVLAKVPVVVHKPIVPLSAVPVAAAAPFPVAPAPVPIAPSPFPVAHAPFPVAHAPFPVASPALPVPVAPAAVPLPIAPPQPNYAIVPGGASVTSYSVNYPRALLPQPAYPRPFVPAIGAPAVIPSVHAPAVVPAVHHHHHAHALPVAPHFHPAPVAPHFHPVPAVSHYHPHFVAKPAFVGHKPVIPVAVPVPGIRYPKIPVFFNQPRPVFPQLAPSPAPTPSFVPVAVPANPQPAVINPGIEDTTVPNIAPQDTNMVFPQIPSPLQPTQPTFVQQQPGGVLQPVGVMQPGAVLQPGAAFQPGSALQPAFFPQQPAIPQQQPSFIQPTLTTPPQPTRPTFADRPLFMPQNPLPIAPTRPTFSQQPSLHIPPMTSGMRPIVMMTHRPQPTQPTFTNKAPYNYHAPAVPFNHNQASSANNGQISGHGQMASQLMQQLALYQQQQHSQQLVQQQESMWR